MTTNDKDIFFFLNNRWILKKSNDAIEKNAFSSLRKMIARCTWTFAKTMPWCPHEYIVRGKCPLTDEEFLFFIEMQRKYGKVERWGKYITPYLYIDGYKYWTMGAPVEETIVMNRAKGTVERSNESDEECRWGITKALGWFSSFHIFTLILFAKS